MFNDQPKRFSLTRCFTLLFVCLLGLPCLLMPLLFTGFNTNTIIIKETVLQITTFLLLSALLLLWYTQSSSLEQKTRSRPVRLFYGLSLILLGYLFISAYGLASHPRAGHAFSRWLTYLLLAIVCVEFARDKHRFHAFINITVLSALLVSVYAVFQAFEIDFFEWTTFEWEDRSTRRVCSSLCNPDFLAGYLIALLPLTITLALIRQGKIRGFFIFCVVFEILALIFSYSRGGWVSMFFVLILLLSLLTYLNWIREPVLLEPGITLARAISIIVTVIILTLVCVTLMWDELTAAIYRFSLLTQGTSVATRSYFYAAAITMWLTHPWFGFGLGTFAIHFNTFRDKELSIYLPFKRHYLEHVHNEYLEILSETGVVGLILYLALIGLVLFTIWRHTLRYRSRNNLVLIGFLCGIIAILIHNMVTVTLRQTPIAFIYWTFLGVALGGIDDQTTVRRKPQRILRPTLVCLIPVVSVFLFYTAVKNYAADSMMREGYEAIKQTDETKTISFNREKMEHALVLLRKSAQLAPDRIQPYNWMALGYYQFHDYQQARRAYIELDRLYKNFTATPMNLAITSLKQADYILSQKDLYPPEVLAQLLQECGKEANRWIERAIKNDPTAPEYYYIKGRSYLMTLNDIDAAEKAFQQALKKAKLRPFEDPKDMVSIRNLLNGIKKYRTKQNAADDNISSATP